MSANLAVGWSLGETHEEPDGASYLITFSMSFSGFSVKSATSDKMARMSSFFGCVAGIAEDGVFVAGSQASAKYRCFRPTRRLPYGISPDDEVIELANRESAVLLTNDKDLGGRIVCFARERFDAAALSRFVVESSLPLGQGRFCPQLIYAGVARRRLSENHRGTEKSVKSIFCSCCKYNSSSVSLCLRG